MAIPELATAAPQRKAYVTNENSNTVSVIDADPTSKTFNTVLTTVTVGPRPRPLGASPDGAWVYVMNHGLDPNTVSVISTATDTVVGDPITVGSTSRIAFRPDSAFAYAVNEDSNNITVIRTADRAVVDTLLVGTGPKDGAICPAGPYAVVYNHGSNDVSIIDFTMNVVAATVAVGGNPLYGVFRPGCAFFFVLTGANTVVAIDMSSLTAVATVPVGISPVWGAVRPDGASLYVTNKGSDNVSVIDTTSPPFPEARRLTVGNAPVSGGMLPNGAFLYVINQGSGSTFGTVSKIDTSKNLVVGDPIAVETFPAAGVVRPNGSAFSVLNLLSRSVSVIDTTSDTVSANIFFGWDLDMDFHPDITADTNWLYVNRPVSNTVLAGDLVNFVVAMPIDVGLRPTHVAIAQVGPL